MGLRLARFRAGRAFELPVPSENPNGIPSQSQGLRGTSYLGKTSEENPNPNGVVANVTRAPDENEIAATALRLGNLFHDDPR